ncbi:MAG TPA: hypothetical protein VGI06_10055, partial [Acidimicrobiales bacterium]
MSLPVPAPVGRAWSSVAYRGRHRRRGWSGERDHVEVRGLAAEAGADGRDRRALAEAVEREARAVPGVRWAVANPVLGRVVVAWEPGARPEGGVPAVLMAAIERAEAASGTAGRRMPIGLPEHPADHEPGWRALTALVADAAGVTLGVTGTALRRSPIPTELAALAGLMDSEPHVRALVSDVIGPVTADVALAVTNATTQGLAQGPVGVVSDLVWRAAALAEVTARRRAWAEAEPELCQDPEMLRAPFLDDVERPVAMPPGAVERYADRAIIGGVAAGVSAAVTTGQPGRAAAGLYAGLPKAARLGREVFAVHLTRRLSGRGALVLDAAALRRLDRVDTLVLDAGRFPREPPGWAVAAVAAARRVGHMVVVAGSPRVGRALGADLTVPSGPGLADAVRGLQADGCVVLLVAGSRAATAEALWAADVGVGVRPAPAGRGRPAAVPWTADVVIAPAETWWLVDASGTAGQVVRQSVALAMLGAATSSAVVFAAPRSPRYSWPVNGAAVLAMANATRAAVALSRREQPDAVTGVPEWHALEGHAVLALVGSRPEGLTTEEAKARVPPERQTPPAALRLLGAVGQELANPLTPVLAAGAALSAALGGAVDASIVAGVTTANALLGGLQRWRTEQAADALAEKGDVTVHVRRSGELLTVGTREVVVGDVVVLRAGDVVPADARILEADGVLADESSLTGESLPVA